jgi:uncharacterized protein
MRIITPESVGAASRCLHAWYLECHGDPSRKHETVSESASEEFRARAVRWIPDLAEPAWDGRDWEAGFRETHRLMREGRAWIGGGVLIGKGLRGQADLLRRVAGRSRLGIHSYVPVKLKEWPVRVEKRDVYELRTLGSLLQPVLGRPPRRGWIGLGPGRLVEIDLSSAGRGFELLLSDMRRIRNGEIATEGRRHAECARCPWSGHCGAVWRASRDVCLLPGVRPDVAHALREAGLPTWTAVAGSNPARVAATTGLAPAESVDLWLHGRARLRGKPILRRRIPEVGRRPIHFLAGEFRQGRCTLLGTLRLFEGRTQERLFVAGDSTPAAERAIWQALLDRLARDEHPVVFTWSDSEGDRLEALGERHRGDLSGWRRLTRGRMSLGRFVRSHVALPVSTYRLSEVAACFDHAWTAEARPGAWPSGDAEALRRIAASHGRRLEAMRKVYAGLQLLLHSA